MTRLDLSNLTIKQLIELDACTRCGECLKWCPAYTEGQDVLLTPLEKINAFKTMVRGQYGLRARLLGPRPLREETLSEISSKVYRCTLCNRCSQACPVKINSRSLWVSMRENMVQIGNHPESMDVLKGTVTTKYNLTGEPNQDRTIWTENLEHLPEGLVGRKGAEYVYFVGCVASFFPLGYGIPQSLTRIMEKAKLDFTVLGGEEWCCGFPLLGAGMKEAASAIISHNLAAVRGLGASKLVTTCPSCYHTWNHEYSELTGKPLGFEVLHATQLVEGLIGAGKLKLGSFERKLTYHDPCDLGRNGGIYDAPRNIIKSIPNVSFAEMEETREYALCCGGGGNLEMVDAPLSAAIGKKRIEQARATGAQVVLSSCQQCKRAISAAVRRENARLLVMDVVELVGKILEEA